MKRHLIATTAAAVLAGCLVNLPAQAGSGSANAVRTIKVAPQVLEVASNGSSYTQVAPLGNIVADVWVGIKTGGSINSWTTWLRIGAEGQDDQYQTAWIDFSSFSFDQSYPQGKKPSVVDRVVKVSIPAAAYGQMAVSHCNALAAQLRADGLSDKKIFGQNRTIKLGVRAELQYDSNPFGLVFDSFGYSDSELDWADIEKFDLVCKKWGGSTIPQVGAQFDSLPPAVESASLTVLEHATLIAGRCRITLSGVVETSAPNADFSFRYKDAAGHQSEVFELATDHTRTAMFSHEYDIPINADGGESGKIRIVGVSGDFTSAWASYDMDCTAPSFEALLPPKLTMQVIPREQTMVGHQYCPTEVKIVGKIEGRSEMSGYAGFVGDDNYLSPPQAYEVQKGDIVLLGADRELDWSEAALTLAGQPRSLTIQLGFNVTGPSGTIVASLSKKDYTFTCMIPSTNVQAGQGVMSGPPRPDPAPAANRLRLAPRSVPGAGPDSGPATTPPTLGRPVLSVAPPVEPKAPRLRLQRQRQRN